MASWQAHALDLIMRVQVKRKVRRASDVAQARKILGDGILPPAREITIRPETIGGIAGEWAEPSSPAKAVLLYLHGGGYFACSPRTHRPIAAAYAQNGFRVFSPDYRLAPEHPFPAAIEDAKAAWHGLAGLGHEPQSLALSGDSAGGGLTLALLLRLRDGGHALPAACVLFSPWTDLAITGASIATNARRDAMFDEKGLGQAAGLYLNGADPKTPLASPLYADFTGLPPMLIHCGEREMLRDDSVRLAERATACGVKVELQIWPVLPHVWQLAQFVPEARTSVHQASTFLLAATKSAGAGSGGRG